METAITDWEVGYLWVKHVRDLLNRQKVRTPSLTWYEGSGWITRTFTIKGPRDVLVALRQQVNSTAKGF